MQSDAPLLCSTCENTHIEMFCACTACSHKPQYYFSAKALLLPIRLCVFWQISVSGVEFLSWYLVVKGQLNQ